MSQEEYQAAIDVEIAKSIKLQEELGLDVLVHGEFERTDMVEFFGQQLSGFAFTENGWVQSYGSRYVRPPIIYGDVIRTAPMTVREFKVAQSLQSNILHTNNIKCWVTTEQSSNDRVIEVLIDNQF